MSDHNSFLEDASEVVPEDSVSQAGVTPTQGGTQGDDPEMEAAQKKLASLRERNPLYDFFNLVRRGSVISLVCRTCLDEKLRPTKPLKFDPASGTSNLTNHMKERHKMDARKRKAGDDSETTSVVGATPGQSIRDYFGGSGAKKRPKLEANLENHRVAEVAWIVRRDIPFAEVESEDYRLKEKMLNRDYVPISADTVSRYISQMYDQAKSHVKSQLQSIPGRASFTWDVWTTDHHPRQFLAIVLHAVSEDWEKMEVPFGFEHITNHTGEGMAAVFQNITEDMNIFRKFVAATTDNASDNGAMIVKLSALHRDLGVKYDPKEIWGRCMGHVVNLICQAMLKNLGALPPSDAEQDKAEADEAPEDMVPEDDMNFEEEEEETIDFGFIPMANMQMSAPANKKKRQVPTPIQKALNKARAIGRKLRRAEKQWLFFVAIAKEKGIKNPLRVQRDQATRWNSTYNMIKVLLRMESAVRAYCKDYGTAMQTLTDDEWTLLKALFQLLGPFNTLSQKLQASSYPSISMVLPQLYELRETLAEFNVNGIASLAQARQSAFDKLDKYLTIVKGTTIYSIAMVFDPRIKATIFKALYSPEKAETILNSIEAAWEEKYGGATGTISSSNEGNEGNEGTPVAVSKLAALIRDDTPSTLNEFRAYLQDRREKLEEQDRESDRKDSLWTISGLLKWWHGNANRYPTLAKMARDYLAIPATSADTERLFSQAKNMAVANRSSLKPDTIMKCQLLKHWIGQFPELLGLFNLKTRL